MMGGIFMVYLTDNPKVKFKKVIKTTFIDEPDFYEAHFSFLYNDIVIMQTGGRVVIAEYNKRYLCIKKICRQSNPQKTGFKNSCRLLHQKIQLFIIGFKRVVDCRLPKG
jgi:hypothetical protein